MGQRKKVEGQCTGVPGSHEKRGGSFAYWHWVGGGEEQEATGVGIQREGGGVSKWLMHEGVGCGQSILLAVSRSHV